MHWALISQVLEDYLKNNVKKDNSSICLYAKMYFSMTIKLTSFSKVVLILKVKIQNISMEFKLEI